MAQGFTGSQTIVTGSGGANRVAVWASSATLTSDGNFTYAAGTLAITNGKIQAKGNGSSYGIYAGSTAGSQWYDDTTQSFFIAADTWRSTVPIIVNGYIYNTTSPIQASQSGINGGFIAGSGGTAVQWYESAGIWQTGNSVQTTANLTVGAAATFTARTATRVAYFGTGGLLSDDSGLVWDATNDQLQLPTTGSGAGLLVGGDVQWYRSAANTWRTPDSVIGEVGLNLGSNPATVAAAGFIHLDDGTNKLLGVRLYDNNTLAGRFEYFGNNGAGNRHFSLINSAGDFLGLWTTNAKPINFYINSAQKAVLDTSGNFGVNTTSFGTSATSVFGIGTGTAPTTGPADTVQFYSSDDSAGNTVPSFYCEGSGVVATGQADSASSVRVKMRINGTVRTFLCI